MYRGLLGLLGHGELVVLVTALHFTSLMVLKVTSLSSMLLTAISFYLKFYIGHMFDM